MGAQRDGRMAGYIVTSINGGIDLVSREQERQRERDWIAKRVGGVRLISISQRLDKKNIIHSTTNV